MQPSICTIGYEGTTVAAFIAALKKARVEIVLDIREIPLSRKEGFSKNHLAHSLRENDIGYAHLQGLGNPKAGREMNKHGETDWRDFYAHHLESKIAQEDLKTAMQIAKERRAALLCFERDPLECHRLITANALAARSKQNIEHLFVPKDENQGEMF